MILGALLVIQALLLLHDLGTSVLWNDEGLSFFIAMDGVHEALTRVARDVHGPLYYVILALMLKLGQGIFTLRILSVLSALVATVFVYLSARMIIGRTLALVAAALFIIAPENIDWAQHARPYSFQTMLVAIALWGFVQILLFRRNSDRLVGSGIVAAIRNGDVSRATHDAPWIVYIVAGGCALLAQHPAALFVFGCNVVIGVIILSGIVRYKTLLINWTIAQILLIAIWLTWLPQLIAQVHQHLAPDEMSARHGNYMVANLQATLVDMLGVPYLWGLRLVAFVIYLALVAFGLFAAIRTRSSVLWIYLLMASPLVVAVVGYFFHPIFAHVIFVLHWLPALYVILIAFAIGALRYRVIQLGVCLVLAAFNLRAVSNYYHDLSPNRPDKIADFIVHNARKDDGIIFSPTGAYRYSVTYYLPRDWWQMPGLDPLIGGPHLITSADAVNAHPRNWVIVETGQTASVPDDVLAAYGPVSAEQRFGTVVVRRFDRKS